MSNSVAYDKELDMTVITYRGSVDLPSLKEGSAKVAQIARQHSCSRVLVDFRETVPTLSTADLYTLPEIFSDILSSRDLRIMQFKRALVVSINLEDHCFFENTSQNRNQDVRVFQDIEEAKAWLSGQ